MHAAALVSMSILGLGAGSPLLQGSRATCNDGPELMCFGVDGGVSHDLDPKDIENSAHALRYLWRVYQTFPVETECSESSDFFHKSDNLTVVAKHINPSINSSVTHFDIGQMLDGGYGATPEQRATGQV